MTVPITEEFNDSQGRLAFYDSYDPQARTDINSLKHVDIRSFLDYSGGDTVQDLSTYSVAEIEDFTMADLELGEFNGNKERWSDTVVTGFSSFNRPDSPNLFLPATPGPNFADSVSLKPIDLETGFDDDDYISLALPSFPGIYLDLTKTYIEFSSDPDGLFDNDQSKKIYFSQSLTPLTVSGQETPNVEFRVLRSALNGIDLKNIYGVRFFVHASFAAYVYILAIRLLGKNWKYGKYDIQTKLGRYKRAIPPDGDFNRAYDRSNTILWRSGKSVDPDPLPIDMEVGALFNTGGMTGGVSNEFTLYFRELTEDFLTQIDINGLTQAQLNGKVQPDVGASMYNPRTQLELENIPQESDTGNQLDGQSQYDLERTPDFFSASYLFAKFQWKSSGSLIQIGSSETPSNDGAGYPYSIPALKPYTNYIAFAEVEENSMGLKLYEIVDNQQDELKLVFNTNKIVDDSLISRRRGRFGWFSDIPSDGYLDSIRSRGEVYAEYRSAQFESETPIVGAELFAQASADEELYKTLAPGFANNPEATTTDTDTARTTTTQSWRLTTNGKASGQGFVSNNFLVRSFDTVSISMDIFWPRELIQKGINPKFQIVSQDGRKFANLLPPIIYGDQWESITFDLPFDEQVLPGQYRLAITQPDASSAVWWVDKVSIRDRVIGWSGRAQKEDAWGANKPKWQPYGDFKNGTGYGVVFDERGRYLQTRAQSFRPEGEINRIQTVPKYAELGRLRFDVEATYTGTPPQVSFAAPFPYTAKQLYFVAQTTYGSNYSPVSSYIWYFGDGNFGYGESIIHAYAESGTYTVTLVAIDAKGNRSSFSRDVGVS